PLQAGAETPYAIRQVRLAPESESGAIQAQAGSHPFQFTSTLAFDQTLKPNPFFSERRFPETPQMTRDVRVELPTGLICNPTVVNRCTDLQFSPDPSGPPNLCPPSSALGVASVSIAEPKTFGYTTIAVPLFNLTPNPGEPARFGFEALGVPVILDTSIRSDSD